MYFSGKNSSDKRVTYKAGKQKVCQFVKFGQYFSILAKISPIQPVGTYCNVVLPSRTAAGSQNKPFYRLARLREARTSRSTASHSCGDTFPFCSTFLQNCKP